jgi:NDP-sugar pyrophosphorylase family protein
MIPEGRAVSLEQEIFPNLVGRRFMARPFDGYFVDIGTPASYLNLQSDPSRLLAAIA